MSQYNVILSTNESTVVAETTTEKTALNCTDGTVLESSGVSVLLWIL